MEQAGRRTEHERDEAEERYPCLWGQELLRNNKGDGGRCPRYFHDAQKCRLYEFDDSAERVGPVDHRERSEVSRVLDRRDQEVARDDHGD